MSYLAHDKLANNVSHEVPCPHCGSAPADADGHACDYCRGYAHRPTYRTMTEQHCEVCGYNHPIGTPHEDNDD